MLVFVFGLSERLAQGTTLALMVPPIGLLAAYTYHKMGFVNIRISALVCVGFSLGGLIGANLAESLSNASLEKVFAGALFLISMKMLFAKENSNKQEGHANSKRSITMVSACSYILLGLIAGSFSGLLGIGGGIIIVPSLVFIFGLSQHEAQGTTLALMVPPIGFFAAWVYYQKGDVDIGIALLLCAGFFVGALLGANLAASISNRLLSRIFGVAMLLVACRMFISSVSVEGALFPQ